MGRDGDGFLAQAVADVVAAIAPADLTLGFDDAHFITAGVFDGRQARRQRPRTGLVAAGGSGQSQGLVGSLVVVDGAPRVKDLLTVSEVSQVGASQDLGRQGPMQPLLFALGLGMVRPPVEHAHQPGAPARPPAPSTPRRSHSKAERCRKAGSPATRSG